MTWWRLAAVGLIVSGQGVAAQVDPAAINQWSIRTQEHYRTEQLLEQARNSAQTDDSAALVTNPSVPAPGEADGEPEAPTIQVSEIFTDDSDILSVEEIRAVLDPYENRALTMQQLVEAAQGIQSLYAERGRLAARAFLPAQDVEGGRVRIALVEARLDEITLEAPKSTSADYVRRYLRSEPGELVSVARLEADLQRFNALHDANLRASLAPGSRYGTTNYAITIEEPPRWQPMVFVDNAGRRDVGLERLGLSFANASLLGYRDRFAFAVNLTEELDQGTKGGSLSYDFPINARGTRMTVSYDRSNVVVIGGPIEVLNVRGDARNGAVTFRHPFSLSPRRRVDGFVTYADKKSRTDFDGVELFSVKVRTLSVGADVTWRRAMGATHMRHQFTTDWSGIGGNDDFARYNLDITNTRVYRGGIASTLRFRGQLGSAPLMPSTEQFQLGGIASVRGYDEGLLIGDDGYFASAEVSVPLSEDRARQRAFFFLDHGAAYPFKGNNEGRSSDDRLTSLGAGLSFSLGRFVSGRLSLGFPLNNRSDSDGRDSPRLHFFLQSARF